MKLSNLTKRVLLCVIGIPTLIAIIFVPLGEHNLIFNLFVIVMITLSQLEMRSLATKALGESVSVLPVILTPIFLGLLFLGEMGHVAQPLISVPVLMTIALLIITLQECYRKDKDFSNSLRRVITPMGMLVYPTLLISPMLKLSFGPMAEATPFHLTQFFLLVFANDTGAYIFGLTMGKNSRGIFPPSPKKSFAGLVGGNLLTIGIAYLLSTVLLPAKLYGAAVPPLWFPALLGFCMALTSVVGDLFASLLKRAAGVKDSGDFFPGRGGILDTIDSIIVSAPIYALFMTMLLG